MGKSSTELRPASNAAGHGSELVLANWSQVAAMLPSDLEAQAKQSGALQRRRGIRSALDLLRIVLAYAVLDWPLRAIGVWCVLTGLADVSDVAILKRLRNASSWLGQLLAQLLRQRRIRLPQQAGVRLILRDATTVNRPGSQGTDLRLHLSFDLGRLCMSDVKVPTAQEGESLAVLPGQPGDIVVGDRSLAFVSSLGPTLAAQADVVVRCNWQNTPLYQAADGQPRLDPIAWLRETFADPNSDVAECAVWLHSPQGTFPLRLIAKRLSQEAAERARQKARLAAQKKGRTPMAQTLFACDFILVLTSLPVETWPATRILELYRLRWQIELFFKRSKSLLALDHIRAQDPLLARTYLFGKLLALLLIETLTGAAANLEPDWFRSDHRPLSLWRLTTLLAEVLRELIRGPLSFALLLQHWPRLRRFLCGPPRRRKQQLALARLSLTLLSVVKVPPAPP